MFDRISPLFSGGLVVAVLISVAGAAAAQQEDPLEPEAQAHLDTGLAAYAAGKYEEAIAEFELAYKIDPAPPLLYAWAQAERLSGDCVTALELYERYLATRPKESRIEATRAGMHLCRASNAAEPPPIDDNKTIPEKPIVPPNTVIPDNRIAPPPTPTADRPPWYSDPIGDALTVAGVAGIGAGIGLLILSRSSESRAKKAEFRDIFERHLDDATLRRRLGIGALGVGAALVAGGLLRYQLRGGDTGEVAIGVFADGVRLSGRF